MRKTLRLLGMLLLMSAMPLGFSSCSDDDEPEVQNTPAPIIEFEQDKYHISGEAQTITVNLTVTEVTVTPQLYDIYPWITNVYKVGTRGLIDDYGLEHHTEVYEVQVAANETSEERGGNVMFWAGEGARRTYFTIAIFQSPLDKE